MPTVARRTDFVVDSAAEIPGLHRYVDTNVDITSVYSS